MNRLWFLWRLRSERESSPVVRRKTGRRTPRQQSRQWRARRDYLVARVNLERIMGVLEEGNI
ncbi:hypothetical protein [Geobacter sp.]|uniref:hypothetical protein n=1 Tax=Geobacter sp. TaxID=46610 RepID=UPI0027B9B77B|nr:hypothetical protein [Geobacter sp.]